MANDNCTECGMPPGECYRICPTQDPYRGNQAAEAADHDFNAQFDDVRERYAGEVIPPDYDDRDYDYINKGANSTERITRQAIIDDLEHESLEGFRPNDDGTVTYISPTGGEHTYDPDQAFPPGRDDDIGF